MPTVGTTSKPAYVYDAGTDTWVPVGVGAHTHDTSAFVPYSNYFVAGKNKIINGDFGIWQRGTSFSNPGGVYTADRWDLSYDGSGTTRTVSRQSFTPGTAPVPGYEGQYFYRYARSGGTNGTVDYLLRQKIEDVRTLAGQTVTVSFWAKADANRNMGLDFFQIFGTGGSSNVYVGVGTYSLTTSWQRFTTTVNIPSVSGKTINNADSSLLLSYYVVSSNATWTIDIWGVQLEAGSVATPFTTHTGSIQGELAACQRYYFRFNADNDQLLINSGFANSTTAASGRIQFPVPMRTIPTSLDSANLKFGNYAGSGYAMTSVGFNQTSNIGAQVYGTVSGVTAGHAGAILGNSNGAYVGFNAEL